VYDSSHVGHASNYVRFDFVRRILTDYFGYDLVVQMNVTDIDDKIINRANERGLSFDAVSRQYEQEFLEDMDALNVIPADYLSRVTDYVPEVVDYIVEIVKNGFGYERDGSVYFDTTAFVDKGYNYGKLEPWSVGNGELLAAGEGALTATDEAVRQAKKSTNDFVLWKHSKPGEPTWDSPWGPGRPGWHIECSAMASTILGPKIDIHAGGVDLRFPHHSNEIAQAEAYHMCDQWVNYFLHSGHLHIDGRKMSKSLKNFTTIRECLKRYNARQLRLLFLGHRYDAPMHFSDDLMMESVNLDRTFIDFFGSLKAALREGAKRDPKKVQKRPGPAETALLAHLEKRQRAVNMALADNFDTQTALNEIIQLVNSTNAYMGSSKSLNDMVLLSVGRYLTRMFRVFGLSSMDSTQIGYGDGGSEGIESRESVVGPVLDAFTGFRDSVRRICRAEKSSTGRQILELSDSVRDVVLPPLGVRLEDRGDDKSSKWILEDPETLMLEIARKAKEETENAEEKERIRAQRLAKEEEELRKGKMRPSELFQTDEHAGKYSAFDSKGLPTIDADGTAVTKSRRKALEKEFVRQEKLHARYLAAVADGRLIEPVQERVENDAHTSVTNSKDCS
jgi:cysteinyl-tRNA synthetase